MRGAWTALWAHIRSAGPQLRHCVRVTIAAVLSFALGRSLNIPLGGLWAVLTAVVVTQMSVGASLKAAIEYLTGTLGGAVYGGVIAMLVVGPDEFSRLAGLAIAVAPLAFLAAINPSFRVGPFTAVIVVVGSSVTHAGPFDSALYRVLEVMTGGIIGLAVSFFVFPARAHGLVLGAAARMLELMAGLLPELLGGFTRKLDEAEMLQKQRTIGQAFARLDPIGAEAARERVAYLTSGPDPAPLLRTLLRLRHDLVMIGRAAVAPLPEAAGTRLSNALARLAKATADYLRGCAEALTARRCPPPLDPVSTAFDGYAAETAALRQEGMIHDLPNGVVERFYALSFALEQLCRDFSDLEQRVLEYAHSSKGRRYEGTE